MKTHKIALLTAVTLSCAPLPLWAQASDDSQTPRDRDMAKTQSMQPLGDLRRANQIIGEEIKDAHDQKLGKVKDLALDLQNGRIAEVIVATGGTIGMDEKLVAMPPESFICDRTEKALRLKGDQAQLKNAPEFRFAEWNKSIDPAMLSGTYQRFGTEPYFFVQGRKMADINNQTGQDSHYYSFDGQNALPRLGYIARATRLLGTTAKNQQDESLGTVNNLVIDLPAGRVVEVVVGEGGFLGMDRELRAVPPQAFHWNADNSELNLDTTPAAFLAMSHFNSSQWGYAYEPESIKTVYRNYNVPPYFVAAGPESGAQNVREKVDESVTALEQGNSEDVNLTEHIRQAIQSNGATSADAANVKVITTDGRVTLRGAVATDDEKRMMGDTAARFVSADRVDNQIEVKPPTTPFHASGERRKCNVCIII